MFRIRPTRVSVCALAAFVFGLYTNLASANPILTITGGTQETIGDPGGTNFANPSGSVAGRGLPTVLGGWPAGAPGFGPDPTFGNNQGITGYKGVGANLTLSETSRVSFTFYGKGDSVLANQFYVDAGSGYQQLFPPYSQDQTYTFDLPAGLIKFRYVTGNGVTIDNGSNNDVLTLPGYFLGVDPYLASGTFQTTGNQVYIGLTDLPRTGDHDFQDLGVRVQVSPIPEPASMAIFGGLVAVGGLVARRRMVKVLA